MQDDTFKLQKFNEDFSWGKSCKEFYARSVAAVAEYSMGSNKILAGVKAQKITTPSVELRAYILYGMGPWFCLNRRTSLKFKSFENF